MSLGQHIRTRSPKAFFASDTGVATIEFVVTLPLFLAALAFAFEFGEIFLAHQRTVDNVRSAARFLSRSDLSGADQTVATNIVRTGLTATPSSTNTPYYLTSARATVAINPAYGTFSSANFTRSGVIGRIRVQVNYPVSILGFAIPGLTGTIPLVVVEDFRFVGV